MKGFVIVNEKDNVTTALKDFKKGENVGNLILQEDIKAGHKFALIDIKKDELVIKYAEPIAMASRDIKKGEWVHVHNTCGTRGRGDKI